MYPPIREVGSRFFLSPLLSPMFPFNRLLFHNTIAPRATMFLPALGGVMATALAPAALLWRVIAPPFPHRFRLLNSLAIALALGALLWWVTAPPFPRRFRLLNSRVAYHGHLGIDDICFVFDGNILGCAAVTAPPLRRRFRLLNGRDLACCAGDLGINDICFVFGGNFLGWAAVGWNA